MKVTEITVEAGRTFNHPHEQYSNLRPSVTMVASIEADEDPEAAVKVLQRQAERLVEDHKNALLRSLDEIEHIRRAEREVADLGDRVGEMQRQLERARKYLADRSDGDRILPPAVEPVAADPPEF